ncbi:hypothetical protein TWF696_003160 [Orbilia brochopaga]|uniref:Zn(2)-C6 fungal-type domain-containing protein n=1 Tax=Orbilia brochopaga TaxID=3140254 RepID=A0AAV9TZX9_9PEZI
MLSRTAVSIFAVLFLGLPQEFPSSLNINSCESELLRRIEQASWIPTPMPTSMANNHVFTRSNRRRSCRECRNRRTRCELQNEPDGSTKCLWCIQHGKDCDLPDDEWLRQSIPRLPNDGFMIMKRRASAQAGIQCPLSFCLTEDSKEKFFQVRQEYTEKHSERWSDLESTSKLSLDRPVANHLEDSFFARVQPYIPIITRTYLKSIQPSQLLLAAIYGVAARLKGVLVSTRDFVHIKNVLHSELLKLINNYKPSLQACIALACIHLTLELQTDGINDVEAWPLRLGMLVRMVMELKLHKRSAQRIFSKDEQEMRRRIFWAVFIKDRWTSTGKGYPLMISIQDIDLDLPSVRNLDPGYHKAQHHFFVELLQQSLVLGKCHPVAYRADRFKHVTVDAFREAEAAITELQHRLTNFSKTCKDCDSQKTLALTYTALKLLFYNPFFIPNDDTEAEQFALFLPNITKLRISLAREALSALRYASRELVHSDPAIWGIGYYAQVRCYLVCLSIKHDSITDYPAELRAEAERACENMVDIAKGMCEEKWSFKQMSGTLVLFCNQVAEDRKVALSPSAQESPSDISISPNSPVQRGVPQIQKHAPTPRRTAKTRKRKLSYNMQAKPESTISLPPEYQQVDYGHFPRIFSDTNMVTPANPCTNPVALTNAIPGGLDHITPDENLSYQNWNWATDTGLQQDFSDLNWDALKHFYDSYGSPSFL